MQAIHRVFQKECQDFKTGVTWKPFKKTKQFKQQQDDAINKCYLPCHLGWQVCVITFSRCKWQVYTCIWLDRHRFLICEVLTLPVQTFFPWNREKIAYVLKNIWYICRIEILTATNTVTPTPEMLQITWCEIEYYFDFWCMQLTLRPKVKVKELHCFFCFTLTFSSFIHIERISSDTYLLNSLHSIGIPCIYLAKL